MILNDDKLNIKNQIGDYKMRKNWIIKNIVIFYYIKLKIYIFIYVHMYKRAAVYKINTFQINKGKKNIEENNQKKKKIEENNYQ